MREIVENIFPRGNVDTHIAPFFSRNFCQTPFHQRFTRGYDLHHGGMPGVKIALDQPDQGRCFHGGEEMAKEALLGALERGARRGFGLPVQCAV